MAGITDPLVETYCAERAAPEPPLLAELARVTRDRTTMPGMMVGRLEGALLAFLVRLTRARRVVEIGTFTGYSALWIAEALPDDGEVVTLDIDPETNKIARDHWGRSPHGGKIHPVVGDARATLPELTGTFDLAFIDADKTSYDAYYEALLPKMRTDGLLVVDNTLWSAAVLAPPDDDEDARALAAFNDNVARDERVESLLLPIRDGVTLVRKR